MMTEMKKLEGSDRDDESRALAVILRNATA